MIPSGIFTKSACSMPSQIEVDIEEELIYHPVRSASMFHLIHAYVHSIYANPHDSILFKQKYVFEFGRKTAFNLIEEECLGYLKYRAGKPQKSEKKMYVGEMKLLNDKVWATLCGSKGKLFSIGNSNSKDVNCYKIDDSQFILGRSVRNSTSAAQIEYKMLLLEFVRGMLFGSLQKLHLEAETIVNETPKGEVYAQINNLVRIVSVSQYTEYTNSFKDSVSEVSSHQ